MEQRKIDRINALARKAKVSPYLVLLFYIQLCLSTTLFYFHLPWEVIYLSHSHSLARYLTSMMIWTIWIAAHISRA